ncbi:MAG: xanthine dehydrogenase accessory protein XdhC [Pseudomonadota bacterium]
MHDWPRQVSALIKAHGVCATVTVTAIRGSAPREIGSKLWLSDSTEGGTIGGGYLEHTCQDKARSLLQNTNAAPTRRHRYALGSQCGQCCGGVVDTFTERLDTSDLAWLQLLCDRQDARVTTTLITDEDGNKALYDGDVCLMGSPVPFEVTSHRSDGLKRNANSQFVIETVVPAPLELAIFGAGHVGRACAQVMATLDARIIVVDSRAAQLEFDWPESVIPMLAVDPVDVVNKLSSTTHCLVMTHDHGLDLRLVDALLSHQRDGAYLGLIGSRSKRRRFDTKLRALGHSAASLQQLICPIGIDQVTGKQPGEIAIAVAAEVLASRAQEQAQQSVRAVV